MTSGRCSLSSGDGRRRAAAAPAAVRERNGGETLGGGVSMSSPPLFFFFFFSPLIYFFSSDYKRTSRATCTVPPYICSRHRAFLFYVFFFNVSWSKQATVKDTRRRHGPGVTQSQHTQAERSRADDSRYIPALHTRNERAERSGVEPFCTKYTRHVPMHKRGAAFRTRRPFP